MKSKILITLIFVSLISYSQEVDFDTMYKGVFEKVLEESSKKTVKIYDFQNGIKNFYPSFELEDGKLYEIKNNIRSFYPIKEFTTINTTIPSQNYEMIINHSTNTQSRTDFLTDYVKGL